MQNIRFVVCNPVIGHSCTYSSGMRRPPGGGSQSGGERVALCSAGDAKTVNAQVVMGVGRLTIEGGAKDLLDGRFVYNVPPWHPEVSYNVAVAVGELVVQQPRTSGTSTGNDVRYDWNLRLNNDIPTNLKIIFGAGDGYLNLGGMSLTDLRIQSGAANVTLNLSGNWRKGLNASIEAGTGNLGLVLPKDTGAIVSVENGVGAVEASSGLRNEGNAYINNAYGRAVTNLTINVRSGVSKVGLTVA
jgi:hypothetical protein